MRSRVGQVWQLAYLVAEPIVLVISSDSSGTAHRCLVLDDSTWVAGQLITLGDWGLESELWRKL